MTKTQNYIQQLTETVKTACQNRQLDLWGIEPPAPVQGKGRILRIFVDSPDGINIDQCAELSRSLGVIFDAEETIPGAYTLEVSSPGLDRSFFSANQLSGYINKILKVTTRTPLEGRSNFTGTLKEVNEDHDSFQLACDGEIHAFSWIDIKKAKLKYPQE